MFSYLFSKNFPSFPFPPEILKKTHTHSLSFKKCNIWLSLTWKNARASLYLHSINLECGISSRKCTGSFGMRTFSPSTVICCNSGLKTKVKIYYKYLTYCQPFQNIHISKIAKHQAYFLQLPQTSIFKIYSLSDFQIYNIAVSFSPLLYTTSPELISHNWSSYLLTIFIMLVYIYKHTQS